MLSALHSIRSALFFIALPAALAAQDTNDPPGRVGRISSVLGTVAFQAAGLGDWSTAPLNYTVTSGDRLLTSRRARAEMEVGPFDVRLSDSTDLTVVQLTDEFAQLGLAQGTLRVSVYRLARGDSMEIDTPNGALIIRSAGRYRIDVLPGVSTLVTTDEGSIELSGPGLDQTLRRGQTAELTGSNPILATLIPKPRATEFDEWSADRDRRQELSDCAKYVSRDIPGCADLNDHGRWDSHPEYGHVWRPTIVQVGWVPYRYGRWVWSGPWGYTWVEDSPWGFAPFHYGRWVTVGSVWVWAPGPIVRRPCYAPALVVFVGGPAYGRPYHAWFPLGPREPYFPRYRHSDRYLRQVNITNVRNVTNVDVFVDPRRADRIHYTNRQATTAVREGSFGRGRPVLHDAVNVRPEEVTRAPIARSRWDSPRLSGPTESQPATSAPFERRRTIFAESSRRLSSDDPQPTRVGADEARPRERPTLVSRNSPTLDRSRTSTSDNSGYDRTRTASEAEHIPRSTERRPMVNRVEPSRTPPPSGAWGQSRRGGVERAADPRESSPPPQRTAAPRQESRPRVAVSTPRLPTRSRPPE